MKLEISYNETKNGIELLFSDTLTEAMATTLKALGFKKSFNTVLKWYATNHPALANYAEALKKTLAEGSAISQTALNPSYSPSEQHISEGKFSLVVFVFENEDAKEYVVFEPYKRIAHTLAKTFANVKFPDQKPEIKIYPRKYKRKVRELLKAQLVIDSTIHTNETDPKAPADQNADTTTYELFKDNKFSLSGQIYITRKSPSEFSYHTVIQYPKKDSIEKEETQSTDFYKTKKKTLRQAYKAFKKLVSRAFRASDIFNEESYEAETIVFKALDEFNKAHNIIKKNAFFQRRNEEESESNKAYYRMQAKFKNETLTLLQDEVAKLAEIEMDLETDDGESETIIASTRLELEESLAYPAPEMHAEFIYAACEVYKDFSDDLTPSVKTTADGIISNIMQHLREFEDWKFKNQPPIGTIPKGIITDLIIRGENIPHTLAPKDAIPPFLDRSFDSYGRDKLQIDFPRMHRYNDVFIRGASALELFYFAQMPHPTEYGFRVSRSAVLKEWNTCGKKCFERLGFPTEFDYPYVNIHSGYRSVYPLRHTLNQFAKEDVQNWWSTAESYRPIGDIMLATIHVSSLIKTSKEQQEKHINPKTGKVLKNAKDKESHSKLDFTIGQLERSKEVLTSYQKNHSGSPIEKFLDYIAKNTIINDFEVKMSIRANYRELGIAAMSYLSDQLQLRKLRVFYLPYISEESGSHYLMGTWSGYDWTITIKTPNDPTKKTERLIEGTIECKDSSSKLLAKKNFTNHALAHYAAIIAMMKEMIKELPDPVPEEKTLDNYIDKTVAIMHGHYQNGKRLTKKPITELLELVEAPTLGKLWEAVELSWLLWYQALYHNPGPFIERFNAMIHFWNEVQPRYEYSDSSKEQYKQYSTSCPISAIIAEYTGMPYANRVFEPSAGNGLLVLGSVKPKTWVNEIDHTRLDSLRFQNFHSITNHNAAKPFPEEWTSYFDVMVTNPPFATWDDPKFDKSLLVQKYFNKHRGLDKHMRLEHLMCGLALRTLKSEGRAAMIIMGHLYFGEDGYIAKYRPFFNWLYRHYHVDDIINLDSFKLYNKQGAVAPVMLILIRGRKNIPEGVAPRAKEAPELATVVASFLDLWKRVEPNALTMFKALHQLNTALQ